MKQHDYESRPSAADHQTCPECGKPVSERGRAFGSPPNRPCINCLAARRREELGVKLPLDPDPKDDLYCAGEFTWETIHRAANLPPRRAIESLVFTLTLFGSHCPKCEDKRKICRKLVRAHKEAPRLFEEWGAEAVARRQRAAAARSARLERKRQREYEAEEARLAAECRETTEIRKPWDEEFDRLLDELK